MVRKGRRSDNTGSIFRDKYGYWNAQLFAGRKPNGRPQYVRKRSRTESEVVEWLKQQTVKQHHNEPIAPDKRTVEQVLTPWLETVEDTNRYTTHKGYAQISRDHIIPRLGKLKAKLLTPQHVQDMLNALARAGKAQKTIRNVRACLRTAFATVKAEYPAAYLAIVEAKIPKPKKPPPRRVGKLTPEQAQLFLIAVESDRLKALYWAALLLGLRKGELLGLQIEDIDLDAKVLYVRQAAQYQKGKGIVMVPPKTAMSEAPLPLPDVLIPVLREHLELLNDERCYAKWQEHGLLFPSIVGTPISGRNLSRDFKGVLKRADLPDIRFHDLRRSTATLLAECGVHPRVAMEILRHSQISTTMNIYTDVIPQANRDALNALGELVQPERLELPQPVHKPRP